MSEAGSERRWELTLIEKIVGAVLIGLLCWMAVTLQQMTVDVAVIKSELATGNRDRFTVQEGKALSDRVEKLEEQVGTIEQRMDK